MSIAVPIGVAVLLLLAVLGAYALRGRPSYLA